MLLSRFFYGTFPLSLPCAGYSRNPGLIEKMSPCRSARPLTRNQLKRFIRDGFIVLQVEGLPDGFHDQVHSKALGLSEDARHAENGAKIRLGPGGRITAEGKQSDWSTLAEDFETLLDTPCIRGAATTLAGPGCLIPSVGAPSPLTANPFDQQFHKGSSRLHCAAGYVIGTHRLTSFWARPRIFLFFVYFVLVVWHRWDRHSHSRALRALD
eukprot:SAG31_NODE_1152_length_9642_cov_4.124489_6_plen_211_part_00